MYIHKQKNGAVNTEASHRCARGMARPGGGSSWFQPGGWGSGGLYLWSDRGGYHPKYFIRGNEPFFKD